MIKRDGYDFISQQKVIWRMLSATGIVLTLSSMVFVLSSYAERDETSEGDNNSGDADNEEIIMDPHTFIQMYAESKERVLPDIPVSNKVFQPNMESHNHDFDDNDYHQSSWSGVPEEIEAETSTMGIEIHLDYIVSIDDEKKSGIAKSDKLYNGGIRLMAEDTMVFNFFAQCHSASCVQPNEVRSVYLVSRLIDDIDIVYENIEEDDKIMFEPIEGEINKFRLPTIDALFGHDNLYKMVVHTGQTDEIDGYYIVEDVEIV